LSADIINYELEQKIVENIDTFVICEGGISSPQMAKKAL